MAEKKLHIIDATPELEGWLAVKHMIKLMGKCLESDVTVMQADPVSRFQKLKLLCRSSRKRHPDGDDVLIVAPTIDKAFACLLELDTEKLGRIAFWCFDAFWTERVSRIKFSKLVDKLYITSKNDVEFYQIKTGIPTQSLMWGSDVLGLGTNTSERDFDLLRVGRQPDFWNEDAISAKRLAERKLIFHGRPKCSNDLVGYQNLCRQYYGATKYVLAHSNFADTSKYTHPTKEYITGRWTDALACGAVIIGQQPLSDPAFSELMWEGATVNICNSELDNLDSYLNELKLWTPKIAKINHVNALKTLDWRWRIFEIAKYFDLDKKSMMDEINDLRQTIKNRDVASY